MAMAAPTGTLRHIALPTSTNHHTFHSRSNSVTNFARCRTYYTAPTGCGSFLSSGSSFVSPFRPIASSPSSSAAFSVVFESRRISASIVTSSAQVRGLMSDSSLRWRSPECLGISVTTHGFVRRKVRGCFALVTHYRHTTRNSSYAAIAASSSVVSRIMYSPNSSEHISAYAYYSSCFSFRSSDHLVWVGETGVRLRKRRCGIAVAKVGQYYGQPARDRVLEFGKFKGAMLGTMSSKYLRWMVNNLKAGQMSHWSEYAEEVLADEHYKDRMEWEKVEKMMTASRDIRSITKDADVLKPAMVFGWDMEDEAGWMKVNLSLLGTTKGGRIPRVKNFAPPASVEKKRATSTTPRKRAISVRASIRSPSVVDDSSSAGSLRDELMRRRALRRDRLTASRGLSTSNEFEDAVESQPTANRFPGREGLLSTVRSYDISE